MTHETSKLMKPKHITRIRHFATAAAVFSAPYYYTTQAHAEDVSTNLDVKALIERINGLEEKVKTLEQEREEDKQKADAGAAAADTNKTERINGLEQKVNILERNREVDQEKADAAAAEAKKTTPQISIGQNGFSLKSADGNFGVQLAGVLQLDSRTFLYAHGLHNDGFLLRRARPILDGTLYRDFDFMFIPDFGTASNGGATVTPTIFDAYLNYRYRPELQFRFGKFKAPVGLEQLQTDVNVIFNERSLVTDLVPNRDVGAMVHGVAFDGSLSYAAGIFDGDGDARSTSASAFNDDREFDGRVFFQPFVTTDIQPLKGFGFGLGGGYGRSSTAAGLPNTTGGTLPGYTTDGQQQFFAYSANAIANGERWRLSPQGYYYWGPLGFMGEYAISDQEISLLNAGGTVTKTGRVANDAWQVTASYVLTGENNTYNGVVPDRPFDPSLGRWGAWQVAVRYADLDIDRNALAFATPTTAAFTPATSASAWSAGLNWWLNKNVRINASFSRTLFHDGGAPPGVTPTPGVTHQPENAVFTRVQLGF
jgi:phosphate-selective porin OprO/OprP